MENVLKNSAIISNVYANESIKEITIQDFKQALNNKELNGKKLTHTAISLVYFTTESKSKTINKKKALNKLSFITAFIGTTYETKVLNQTNRENDVTDKDSISVLFNSPNYKVINEFLCEYTDETNGLIYSTLKNNNTITEYYLNDESNTLIDFETAYNDYFTPSAKKPKAQTTKEILVDGKLIEQTNSFNWQTLKLKNIKFIKINKQVYKLI